MSFIDKTYHTLDEIQSRWDVPRRDLVYLAENGLLALSVRVYGVQLEHGIQEHEADGRAFSLPEERLWFQGLQDLLPRDVHQLFLNGRATVHWFAAPPPRYCHVLQPGDGVLVLPEALVVRREERDRLERERGLGPTGRSRQPAFFQRQDFREVVLGDETFQLGPKQAQVVRLLYEAASREVPRPAAARRGPVVVQPAERSLQDQARMALPDPLRRAWPLSVECHPGELSTRFIMIPHPGVQKARKDKARGESPSHP